MIQPISDLYSKHYNDINIAVWRSLTGSKTLTTDTTPTSDGVKFALLKGGEADYTLVFKDTLASNIKKSAINNYNVFTNNRGVFNIITQSESEESIIKNTTTQLSQYYKGE